MKERQVQIPENLMAKLISYFLILDQPTEELHEAIVKQLDQKVDSLINHDLYTKYKTGATEQEREKARKEYLDRIGIHPDWRW